MRESKTQTDHLVDCPISVIGEAVDEVFTDRPPHRGKQTSASWGWVVLSTCSSYGPTDMGDPAGNSKLFPSVWPIGFLARKPSHHDKMTTLREGKNIA